MDKDPRKEFFKNNDEWKAQKQDELFAKIKAQKLFGQNSVPSELLEESTRYIQNTLKFAKPDDYLFFLFGLESRNFWPLGIKVRELRGLDGEDLIKKIVVYAREFENHYGQKATLYVSNGTFSSKLHRQEKYATYITQIIVDIDFDKMNDNFTIEEKRNMVQSIVKKLPISASDIVFSGRGCYVRFLFSKAILCKDPEFKKKHKKMTANLIKEFEELGGDLKANDFARVMKVPGSFHHGTEEFCRTLIKGYALVDYDKFATYYGDELENNENFDYEHFLEQKGGQIEKPNNIREIIEIVDEEFRKEWFYKVIDSFKDFNREVLFGLERYIKKNKNHMIGERFTFLYDYANYMFFLTCKNSNCPQRIESKLNELNNMFSEPLKDYEIKKIMRMVHSNFVNIEHNQYDLYYTPEHFVVEFFYGVDLSSEKFRRRVSHLPTMKRLAGTARNFNKQKKWSQLIETGMLDKLTLSEISQKTGYGKTEIKNRFKEMNKKNKTDKMVKEAQLAELDTQIIILKKQGKTNKEICELLDLKIDNLKYRIKKLKSKDLL